MWHSRFQVSSFSVLLGWSGLGLMEPQRTNPPSVPTYGVTVEGVEDSRHVAAQDADRDAGVVQRQPATARLL